MSSISVNFLGRFGNQMFQYAVARAYAELHQASFHTKPWVGQKIFELSDQPFKQLPEVGFDELPFGKTNITLHGHFLFDEATKILSLQKLRQWFRLQSRWQNLVDQKEIVAHLRWGDFAQSGAYCLITKESYINACHKYNLNHNNLTWVGEDINNQVILNGELSFLPDFIVLMKAKTILRANSSFSWWAATLNIGSVYSPIVEARVGWNNVEFVPGNWPRIADGSKFTCRLSDLHLAQK